MTAVAQSEKSHVGVMNSVHSTCKNGYHDRGYTIVKLRRDIAAYIVSSFFNAESEEGTDPSNLFDPMDLVIHRRKVWQQHPQAVGKEGRSHRQPHTHVTDLDC